MKNPLSLEVLSSIFRVNSKDPTRIINREGTTIEFKDSYNHCNMAQYFKTIAAFANNQGGYIIFGIGDKPRHLIGLKDKSLSQFEDLRVEDFTKALIDYFSPDIRWDHCTFEFHGLCFGIIYVYPLMRKPCICKKHYDCKNEKYSLKEGDIYYRYGGRSERIRYAELTSIIDETRTKEEQQWLKFFKSVASIGVSNAALLDLKSGSLSGNTGSVVIDSELLQKLVLIQEGTFVETGGTPTLRLVGDIKEISTGKVVLTEVERKIIRAIEPSDIIQAFLEGKRIDETIEYIKRICSATTANYPVYYFIHQASITVSDALSVVNKIKSRVKAREKLKERLEGKTIQQLVIPNSIREAGKKKELYRQQWLKESLVTPIEDIGHCVEAILYLSNEEIVEHEQYICRKMLEIFNSEYEKTKSMIASKILKSICRIDEVLYLEK